MVPLSLSGRLLIVNYVTIDHTLLQLASIIAI
jgi:hypothetical protein